MKTMNIIYKYDTGEIVTHPESKLKHVMPSKSPEAAYAPNSPKALYRPMTPDYSPGTPVYDNDSDYDWEWEQEQVWISLDLQ